MTLMVNSFRNKLAAVLLAAGLSLACPAMSMPRMTWFFLGTNCSDVLTTVDSTQAWAVCSLHAPDLPVLGIECHQTVEEDTVLVEIVDSDGRVVRSFPPSRRSVFSWSGNRDNGIEAPTGAYTVRFTSRHGVVKMPFCKHPVQFGPHRLLDPPLHSREPKASTGA